MCALLIALPGQNICRRRIRFGRSGDFARNRRKNPRKQTRVTGLQPNPMTVSISGCAKRACARRGSGSHWRACCSPRATAISRPKNCTRKRSPPGVPVSLATVYNALHQFTQAGMLRILAVEGAKTYFDTNTSDHHHFFVEGENRVFDIEAGPVERAEPARAARRHGNCQCRCCREAASYPVMFLWLPGAIVPPTATTTAQNGP